MNVSKHPRAIADGNNQRNRSDANQSSRLRAAWLYHIEGKTQSEVADTLGLSRIAVTRLLSEARRRGEVQIRIQSGIAAVVALERRLENKFGLSSAVVAPHVDPQVDPTRVISAAAGQYITGIMGDKMTVGVGWGQTLYAALPHIEGRPLKDVKVISLLGGIAQAKRFNPAEFAWQFAELYNAEGFLIPAPALVDSPQTRHALLEQCGLDQIFQMSESCDVVLLSAGGIGTLTTSYRLGHVTEAERLSLKAAGAVGDVLYNFIDARGNLVDHPVNERSLAVRLPRLSRVRDKILVSGGVEKIAVLRAAMRTLNPTTLITDEQTATALLEISDVDEVEA